MIIQRATIADIEKLMNLKQRLTLKMSGNSTDGFLLASNQEYLEQVIVGGLVLVAFKGVEVVGFIAGFSRQSALFAELLSAPGTFSWDGEDPTSLCNIFYVDGIGVLPEERANGTAKFLFDELNSLNPNPFMTAVVEKPLANLRSAKVISRFGFKRIGQFNSPFFSGFCDYQSGIYLRR